MQKYIHILFVFMFGVHQVGAQSTYAPHNRDYYHLLDRALIKSDSSRLQIHQSMKPFSRLDIIDDVKHSSPDSDIDEFNSAYLLVDNGSQGIDSVYKSDSKRPIFKQFYRSQKDLYEVNEKDFQLSINPVLLLSGGSDLNTEGLLSINTRGLEISGLIDSKVAFYTFVAENQMSVPSYVEDFIRRYGAVPHENFWKTFKTNTLENQVDFFTSRAYIDFKVSKHISTTFGQDRFFLGNGYRSLALSDFGGNYPFLKFNTKIWKFQYTNLYAKLTSDVQLSGGVPSSGQYPSKYLAMHHFSLNLRKNLNIGVFESIIFSRSDSLGNDFGFELAYLNPVIFYRSVEQNLGSPDNALVGVDIRWDLFSSLSLYGQFVLDEFKLNELRSGNGWWANKFAIQSGFKYFDAFGANNFDMQGEINVVRPFMYSHVNNSNSYGHYNQPLAHPMGANFIELIGVLRYQPTPRLQLRGKLIIIEKGDDPEGENFGGNIFLSQRGIASVRPYGNTIGQGVNTNILFGELGVSYMLKHNLWLDFQQIVRRETVPSIDLAETNIISQLSLRMNIMQRLHEF